MEYQKKSTDLSLVIDALYHLKLYQVHTVTLTGIKLTAAAVIGNDCIDICKLLNRTTIQSLTQHYPMENYNLFEYYTNKFP